MWEDIIYQLFYVLRTQMGTGMSLRERARAVLAVVSTWSICGLALRVLFLTAPPLFFELIFLPCFECYDFEAAATHEVGHVLGFGHPDATQGAACCGYSDGSNLHHKGIAAGEAVEQRAFCADPWRDVEEGVHPLATDVREASGVRDSIMKAFTQHNPRVCLSRDDLEGLNVLYPTCETPLLNSQPVCYKMQHNIGWVRLGAFVLIPILLSLLLLVVLNAFVRNHHLRREDCAGVSNADDSPRALLLAPCARCSLLPTAHCSDTSPLLEPPCAGRHQVRRAEDRGARRAHRGDLDDVRKAPAEHQHAQGNHPAHAGVGG